MIEDTAKTTEPDDHDHEGHFDVVHPWTMPLLVALVTAIGLVIVALINKGRKRGRTTRH